MRYDVLIVEPLKDMLVTVVNFIPTLITALLILIIGGVLVHLIHKGLKQLFKIIKLDEAADKIGISHILKSGGIKSKSSDLLNTLTYWVLIIMVLILTVKALGITIVPALLSEILGYIPNVVVGVLVLVIGMLVAKVVSGLIYTVAKNTDMPIPDTLARLSQWAIVIYVTTIFLKEVGFASLFVGIHYTIFIGGVVFALALSFGLAGKDIAARYLDVFKTKKTNHE